MENVKTLTVTLETVTPLFLGGAEPRSEPELRAPACRGALRYWLRAVLGGVIGDNNLAGLHQLESAVFGSTDSGSPIHLRLHGILESSDEKILPHKEGRQAGRRKAFRAGQRMELTMRQFRNDAGAVWQMAYSVLNLALTFGGIGLRSRRGYGTLRIVQSSDPTLVSPLAATSLDGWKQHIKHVAEDAVASARHLAQSRKVALVDLPKGPTRYPCASHLGLIRVCDLQAGSSLAAVTQFMQKAPQDQAFGGIKPRQASPLWVRPIQLTDHYGLLLVVLASYFNGANYPTVQRFLAQHFPGEDLSVKGWNA